jgi:hypothetical protein
VAEILDMQQQRRRLAARRGFAAWSRRFSGSFDEHTSLEDLDDTTLRALIQGGDDASLLLNGLVLGVMKLGKGTCFDDLESPVKLKIMDIALFLLDQLRFEVMRRLDWVEPTPFVAVPIVHLIENFALTYAATKNHTPQLLGNHPRYREYEEVFEADRAVFVRRLVPEALELFEEEPEGA